MVGITVADDFFPTIFAGKIFNLADKILFFHLVDLNFIDF